MRTTLKIFFVLLFLSLLIIRPTPSYAWHGRSYVGVNLGVWPGPYYYGDPYYYHHYYYDPYDYPYYPAEVVQSPSAYQPVIVNGVTYYVNNGVYYVYTQYGYQAVATPAGAPAPAVQASVAATTPAITVTPASADSDDSFVINIPNGKGGFTAVILKRSGKGFTGPQGEFYSEFPKVSQLQVMYGK
ncbi:MAG: hypothetical protein HQL12_00330 [Candidatus Omnitrophica bacterium]|nr:hypothetical protein [Candidatus Omnitrophota bacterium]